jgi:hypothetical protein
VAVRASTAAIAVLSGLLASSCLFGPRLRAVERLCGADDACWTNVERAPELTYYSPAQAVGYGLAYAHELREVRYPRWGDVGVAVYPGEIPGSYRIDVLEVGIHDHVMVQLRENVLAWGHAHPQPGVPDCAPHEQQLVTELKIPIFVQHAEGGLVECHAAGLLQAPRPARSRRSALPAESQEP